jgi:hypothetical protein
MARNLARQMICEMKAFAALGAAEQRYICRSQDVAARGADAARLWSRSPVETASIKAQDKLYRALLRVIRNSIPDDIEINAMSAIIGLLITISAFDLGEGKIECFSAYRFLYERLIGPSVRPWLPCAFVAAAGLPYLHPSLRKALIGSITAREVAAIDWSILDPIFYPDWIDEVELAPSQP